MCFCQGHHEGQHGYSQGGTTRRVEGDTAAWCAARMHKQLEKHKRALRRDSLDGGKQQVLGLTQEVRDGWTHYGEVTHIAKALGVYRYGYTNKRPEMDATFAGHQVTSQYIRVTGGFEQLCGTMVASVLYGICLYGSECHYITTRQTHRMRIMRRAMGDEHGRRPGGLRFFVDHKGKLEPEIVRAKRMIKHWKTEESIGRCLAPIGRGCRGLQASKGRAHCCGTPWRDVG